MLANSPAPAHVRIKSLGFVFAAGGISGLLVFVRNNFPEDVLSRFPEYNIFIYAALAISLVSVIFLLMMDKLVAVSFAQLGAITSLLYIGYALFGIFAGPLVPVFAVLMTLGMIIVLVVFGQSLAFLKREGTNADVALGIAFLGGALFMCAFP